MRADRRLLYGMIGGTPLFGNVETKKVRLVEANISGLYTFSRPELIYRDKIL